MAKTERIQKVVRSAIEWVDTERALDQKVSADRSTLLAMAPGPLDSLSIVELMATLSALPVPPEWQSCIGLRDGLARLEADSQENGDGNR